MKNCPYKSCHFRKACGSLPFVCVLGQYLAIVAVLAWVGYLVFSVPD
ncbi:hypothetical protein [Thiogranum longum]